MSYFNQLKNSRLLAGLPAHKLEAIAARGSIRTLRKHTVFIENNEVSSSRYLILSGQVKVYLLDHHGNEQLLSLLGPGEHLGELALLTDAVRTASAATVEDAVLLALPRRAFIECLADCPQIALNLDLSLEQCALSSDIGAALAARYQAWSRFRHSGLAMVLLIGGCTGTGKSTLAAELALRLDIGRTQSTDILRDIVRLFVAEQCAPELHASSYAAWRFLDSGEQRPLDQSAHLIIGYGAQSGQLAPTIQAVIKRSVKERESIIVEGIHLHPEFYRRLSEEDAVIVPIQLSNPDAEQLKQHFLRRGEIAPSRHAAQYLENFSAIWQIQQYLNAEAVRCDVPVIANVNLEDTVQSVIDAITERLLQRFVHEVSDESKK